MDDSVQFSRGFKAQLRPGSAFRRLWDGALYLGAVSYCFSIPVWVAVSFPPARSGGLERHAAALVGSYLLDLIFILDAVLRYRFFFFLEEGLLVADPDRIRAKFFKVNF